MRILWQIDYFAGWGDNEDVHQGVEDINQLTARLKGFA
jgi:hypothetical protein